MSHCRNVILSEIRRPCRLHRLPEHFFPMTPPKLMAPPGACDCHMHVYEDRYPLVPQAVFKPPHAPLKDYLAVRKALGLSRAVLVQPNGYGFDNRCMLEGLARLSESARAIAIVDPAATRTRAERR